MAGAGFKDFAVGEVLTASDVDTYLMQQSVMRFADAAARGSALGTAVGSGTALAEGMVSYLDDANYVQVYNGSGWISAIPGIGSNVVSATKDDTFSTSSTSYVDVTGLTVTITPTSATSKVLVIASIGWSQDTADKFAYLTVADGSDNNLIVPSAPGSRSVAILGDILPEPAVMRRAHFAFLHSPATTSPFTYKVRGKVEINTLYINRSGSSTNNAVRTASVSTITAIEVAA